jgi:hypothetical protein
VIPFDRHAQERDMTLVPPCDHADVFAGQGTATKEVIEEVGELDDLFACLGGGGLLSGALLAVRALSSTCRVRSVEPEAGNDGQQSLARGEIVHIDSPEDDCRRRADAAPGGTHVRDHPPRRERHRHRERCATGRGDELLRRADELAVEPTGCLGFAGARHGGVALQAGRLGVIVSGGNIDLARNSRLLAANSPEVWHRAPRRGNIGLRARKSRAGSNFRARFGFRSLGVATRLRLSPGNSSNQGSPSPDRNLRNNAEEGTS